MGRRALLLGSTGQLGRAVRCLHGRAGAPFELVAVGRDRLDLAAPDAVGRVLGALEFDMLINCAAWTRVDDAEDAPRAAFAVNARAVQAMARVCAAKRARLLHVSTDYVFGGDCTRDRPLGEDDPTAPVNAYGRSKAEGERLALAEWGDVVILRVAALFGPDGANFVETVLRAAREKSALRVVDDQTVSPTAAADAARVILAMAREGCAPGRYHAVNTGAATWCEFARAILERAGVAARVTPCRSADYPTRAARARFTALDNARVSAAFGAMAPWQEALSRYLRGRGGRDA